MMRVMSAAPPEPDQGEVLLELYDRALPQVYGYLVTRCGAASTAEDLTAETFLAAVAAVQRGGVSDLTVAWLVGVARHKLVDHWRRLAREERNVRLVASSSGDPLDDPWDACLDAQRAATVLATLAPQHRAALTLRYLDGLSVPEVARYLGRTLHATEALLVRSRDAFRRAYDATGGGGEDA
jgi:RNA polymerase sigma-70 factor (ECF subfamily)